MKTKMLTRQILIREHDYDHGFFRRAMRYYDSVNFEPLTRAMMEKENLWYRLQHPDGTDWPWPTDTGWIIHFGRRKDYYDSRYGDWRCVHHAPSDEILITPNRTNSITSVLGRAVLEREIPVYENTSTSM